MSGGGGAARPRATSKLWVTGAAAAKFTSPAWSAWIVHVPAATIVTVVPETVQTAGVSDVKVTPRVEPEVATSSKLPAETVVSATKSKSIVWLAWVIVMLALSLLPL